MSGILIPCPQCSSGLKLRDRSKLGKLGRCPKCAHRFVLEEPEEVELELADPVVPLRGAEAQWVPDSSESAGQSSSPQAMSPGRMAIAEAEEEGLPEFPLVMDSAPGILVKTHPTISEGMTLAEVTNLLGKPIKRKRMSDLAAEAKKRGKAFDSQGDLAKREYLVFQHAAGAYKLIFADEAVTEIHSQPAPDAGMAVAPLVPSRSRRRHRQKLLGIGLGGVLGIALAGVLIYANQLNPPKDVVEKPKAKPAPKVNALAAADTAGLQQNARFADTFLKDNFQGQGKALTFERIPAGAGIIIHLRLAELWSDDPQLAYFRASLTQDVTGWLESTIKQICLFEPKDIEEALICVILGSRGEPPEFAARVKLAEPRKKSDFLKLFGGRRIDDYGDPVYVDSERAYLVEQDLQTFAVAPAHLAEEISRARRQVPVTKPGIERILLHSDDSRLVTVVFEPIDLDIHQEFLIAENVRPVFEQFLAWLGEDVETVAWSMHLNADKFYSQFLFRNGHEWAGGGLEREMQKKLNRLPADVFAAVQMMNPQQVGARKIIGRFPAMMKVYSLSTLGGIAGRAAQFTTVLPAKAAPNLALGTLLAWDESTRTDFTKEPPQPESSEPKLPDLIVDRLKQPMDVDFRRRPLQDAFKDIAEATKVQFDIDGDALKFAGYTKNMPQTFKLGEVPATQAVAKILSQYDKMCVCITDEDKNIVTVMTLDVAKQKGLTPLKF